MSRQEDPYPTFVYLCVRCREEMEDLDMAYAHEVLHYSETERNLEQRTAVRPGEPVHEVAASVACKGWKACGCRVALRAHCALCGWDTVAHS